MALQRFERGERFDMALLDADMPCLDGRALAAGIRSMGTAATAGMALLLVNGASVAPASAPPDQFVAVLSKPVRRAALAKALFQGVTH